MRCKSAVFWQSKRYLSVFSTRTEKEGFCGVFRYRPNYQVGNRSPYEAYFPSGHIPLYSDERFRSVQHSTNDAEDLIICSSYRIPVSMEISSTNSFTAPDCHSCGKFRAPADSLLRDSNNVCPRLQGNRVTTLRVSSHGCDNNSVRSRDGNRVCCICSNKPVMRYRAWLNRAERADRDFTGQVFRFYSLFLPEGHYRT